MQSNIPSPATSPAESEQKTFWPGYQASLSDLFPKPSGSPSNGSSLSQLAASSSYLGKMTNSGQRTQTASRENCSNNLSLCEPLHDIPGQFATNSNSPLVSHSESESPVDLHLYQFATSSAAHSTKICVHRNFLSKCATCNPSYSSLLRSVNKLSPTGEGSPYCSIPSSHLELSNKVAMNSLNTEALLGHDTKHLFGSPSGGSVGVGLGGNPLTGHLGHISTSIAGISNVNPCLSMAGGHLHPSHHHTSGHQSIHSMSSPSFLHSAHLAAATGQRRMSNSTNPNRVSKNPINNKQFLCPMCNKLFTQKGNLKTHMMIHTGDKPYACHVCGKSFTQKGNVDTHIKIHTGVKDYACESCGKSFTQKGNLKTHIRSVHTKEKPYACSVCGKSFSQKGNMHTHIRTHNKDDRFPCGLCGKTFSQKGNLKTHMQRHAGTLPKRYGPGGQRRQTTSRLLQVPNLPVSSIGGAQSAAAAAAAAAYAIAAAGNVTNLERTHQQNMNRNTPVSPDGDDESPSPSSMVHGPSGSLNGGGGVPRLNVAQQQSVISNVQNQQPSREQQVESPSLYPVSSDNSFHVHSSMASVNTLSHLHSNPPNSFNLATTPSAAAAAAAVILSSTSSFSKDPKSNHLHFMSSLFH